MAIQEQNFCDGRARVSACKFPIQNHRGRLRFYLGNSFRAPTHARNLRLAGSSSARRESFVMRLVSSITRADAFVREMSPRRPDQLDLFSAEAGDASCCGLAIGIIPDRCYRSWTVNYYSVSNPIGHVGGIERIERNFASSEVIGAHSVP